MKQSITITLNLGEIIYDIQNKTYLTGRSVQEKSNPSHVANMQANDDDENSAQILRSVSLAVSRLRCRFSEYLEEGEIAGSNTSMNSQDKLSFTLSMPSNFNLAVTNTLSQAAHQFIVATVIADWFAITAKGETADYTLAAESALTILEEALCKRIRPSR